MCDANIVMFKFQRLLIVHMIFNIFYLESCYVVLLAKQECGKLQFVSNYSLCINTTVAYLYILLIICVDQFLFWMYWVDLLLSAYFFFEIIMLLPTLYSYIYREGWVIGSSIIISKPQQTVYFLLICIHYLEQALYQQASASADKWIGRYTE